MSLRQSKPDDGNDLVQALEDRPGDPGLLVLQTPGEIAEQAFDLGASGLAPGRVAYLL